MGDWTEKYRPKTLDEVVGNERAIIELQKWANSWNDNKPTKKGVILSGKPGTGKTSSALALANEYDWTVIELNASDARNATKIKNIATSGAINETFSNDGTFISTRKGGRKLIILDEADNLYDRIENSKNSKEDLSDRGGKKAIIETIKISNQPIILIVNDYYGLTKGGGESLKQICKLIRFYNPYSSHIFNLLKKICLKEGIAIDLKILKTIADRCKGDIRSAVNDLQSLTLDRKTIDIKSLDVIGYRDREKDIFSALREIFKTKNIKSIKESLRHLDADPQLVLLWINENLPKEYRDYTDLVNGYDAISKADVFLGRTRKIQNYALWSYACDMMNGGVATAKTHSYPNDSYSFPVWLREKKDVKSSKELKNLVISKISAETHNSVKKGKNEIYGYFSNMFRNNIYFAIKMKNKLDFSESEIKFILGKSHENKLKEILNFSEKIEPIQIEDSSTDDNEEKKETVLQQSLFDY